MVDTMNPDDRPATSADGAAVPDERSEGGSAGTGGRQAQPRWRMVASGFQRWRSLLFHHRQVSTEILRPLVPRGLELDLFQGQAYLGLVAFDIEEARPLRSLPPVPTAARFLEVNLRTYVRREGQPGVWFFSLEAQSVLAVLGARAIFGLPYHKAQMDMTRSDHSMVRYASRRTSLSAKPADLELSYEIGESIGTAVPGSLEHFLIERYVLFARHPVFGLVRGEVEHQPYPLRLAKVHHLHESLSAAAGVHTLGAEMPALYSPGVDVEISPPLGRWWRVPYFH